MKYFLPEDGETIDDARNIKSIDCLFGPRDYAESVAEYLHDHCDFSSEVCWPIKIAVVSDDNSVKNFIIEREFYAQFSARSE